MFVGVDGCRYGWVAVSLDWAAHLEISLFANDEFAQLCDRFHSASVILIDIPIGLVSAPEKPVRTCDRKAREILGFPRSSSVFTPPCRQAVYADSYAAAQQLNRQITGKGISIQAWHIVPKIKAVDSFLQAYTTHQNQLREFHPELCFYCLNQQQHLKFSKHSLEGYQERLEICQRFLPNVASLLRESHQGWKQSEVTKIDIIDALAGAIAARATANRFNFLLNLQEVDALGLAMDIAIFNTASIS